MTAASRRFGGTILVRDGRWLRRAFEADAPYLFDAGRTAAERGQTIGEMTLQCSKRADAVEVHEPHLNILCFRRRGLDDEQTADLRERLIRSGRAWITTTVLRGERVLRVTLMNPRTTEAHIDAMLDALREV